MTMKLSRMLLAGIAAASLAGCAYEGGYGIESGYGTDYAYGPAYAGGYDGYYGDPSYYGYGYGWYGDYWYPGTGVFVYDRYGHGRRWNHGEQGYWHDHGPRPGGPRPPWHGRPGGGHWTPPPPPQGHGFAGGVGHAVGGFPSHGGGGGHGHHGH